MGHGPWNYGGKSVSLLAYDDVVLGYEEPHVSCDDGGGE